MFKQISDNILYLGIVQYKNLPLVNGSNLQPLVTIPNVLNLSVLVCKNTTPSTITNFIGGAQYQQLQLKGDGFTTIANNTKIKTNTGADKLLSANRMYLLTLIDEVWYEQ